MWGGRITTRLAPPRWLPMLLRRDIVRVYPQLADVQIEHAWAGTMSYAVHKMPQIGQLTPGVWLAGAFGGHGLNTTAMAGTLIARAIVEGDQTWRQFSPFELVWAGGVAGRVAIQMRSWIKRFRDRIAERRAHAREIAHRQAREAELLAQEAVRAQEGAAQAEAAQNVIAEEARPYAEPDAIVNAETEPLERPAAGRHRSRRRKRRERSEGVS